MCKSNHCTISESACGAFLDSFHSVWLVLALRGGGDRCCHFDCYPLIPSRLSGLGFESLLYASHYLCPPCSFPVLCPVFSCSPASFLENVEETKSSLTLNLTFYSEYLRLHFLKILYFRLFC